MNPQRLRAIASMLAAVGFFAAMDALLKLFSASYPAIQVGAMRGAASLPFVLASVAVTGRWQSLRPRRPGLHIVRGLLGLVMLTGFISAVRVLSLADAYAFFFVAPLIVTALAVPVLGEHVDWRRWVAISVGLMGVLVMLRPTGDNLTLLGAAGALVSAAAYAFSAVIGRVMTRTDTNLSMVFSFLVLLTGLAGAIAAPGWVPIRSEHWPWLAALGLVGALGQHFITDAFRHAQASVVAPFEYTAMLWAFAIDWVFWTVLPDARVYAGGTLVIGCGLYLIWRERQLHIELAATTESPASPR